MYQGRKLGFSLGTCIQKTAEQLKKGIETLLWELEQGYRKLPQETDLIAFLRGGGKVTQEPPPIKPEDRLTLGKLRDKYVGVLSIGTMEQNSLYTVKIHFKHLVTTLGETFSVESLSLDDLQQHVERRHRKKYRGKPLSPATLRKEIATFRACWNWAVDGGLLNRKFPNKNLKFPKDDEKPPFQTWEQIDRQIARGGLTDSEIHDLWDCLFLDRKIVADFLVFVKENATQPFLYPMVVFAAHTGARRSELLRVKVSDVDFDGEFVTLHEMKRSTAKRTTRRVPLSPFLIGVLKEWLEQHPGGSFLFCQQTHVEKSKKKRMTPTQITRDEAHDHFQRTIGESKWNVLRGWHILRHSFISNCAAAGCDQRLIDEWVSHQTEEQRRRYRHLFPEQQSKAIRSVFGE